MRRAPIAVLALFLLAACGGEGEAPRDDVGAGMAPATLDLQADGILVPPQGAQAALDVPFGSARAAAEATLGTVLGEPNGRGGNAECGAGPVETTQYPGMMLNFQDGRLVGYYAQAPYVPDMRRGELLADPAVSLVDASTLGEEFVIGEEGLPVISGLFDGGDDTARVSALWAGAVCLFR